MNHWHEQTDVAVIGSGAAGLSAAIEAARSGASVIVCEKMKITGGNTRISDGGLAAPGNHLQKEMGIEDSPELFYADLLNAGLGLNHPRLARLLSEKALEAVEWTRNDLGVAYQERLDRFGGHSVARCLTTRRHSGLDLIKAQMSVLEKLGAEIRLRTPMTRLLTDNDGSVAGIQVRTGHDDRNKSSGTVKNIRARGGVVLASGGFANDIGFRTLQNPALDASVASSNHKGATAEVLRAALEIHAAPVHLSWIQLGPWGCPDEAGYGQGARFASYCVYPFGILVDPATGMRIVNEWSDRRQRCDAIFKTGHACVGILDAQGAAHDADSLRSCLASGKIKAFDSMDRLAAEFNMPHGRLEATVSDYNHRIQAKAPDPFGKAIEDNAAVLDTPPFYAMRLWPKVHYTSGGLGIDSRARVIDIEGSPIPRLFAAGEVCGGVHGGSRLGSCALTECIVFGRVAGQEAAAPVKNTR
jgi:flavocytochrome c